MLEVKRQLPLLIHSKRSVNTCGENTSPLRANARGRLFVSCQCDCTGKKKIYQKGNITLRVRWNSQKYCHSPSSPLSPLVSPLSSRPISPAHLAAPLHGCDKQCRSRVSSSTVAWREASLSKYASFKVSPYMLPHK